ncbi:hypothetical protein BC943DRAFT_330434 [Umbelopsis sp. AD052]|nr:hypothetical protein BC943DRAFT_330434 [Umbelopsis sp. AD052]
MVSVVREKFINAIARKERRKVIMFFIPWAWRLVLSFDFFSIFFLVRFQPRFSTSHRLKANIRVGGIHYRCSNLYLRACTLFFFTNQHIMLMLNTVALYIRISSGCRQ